MRQDQFSDTVVIDGAPIGVWDNVTGGTVTADETKYRLGGMGPQVSLGGPVSVENLTLRRLLDLGRDWDLMKHLAADRCGKASVTVARQPLDADGHPFGSPLVYRGTLLSVAPPESNSNTNDAGVWEIVVATEGNVS